MAVEATGGPMKGKLVLRNISTLFSGDLIHPVLDADTIVAIDGRISAVGKEKDIDTQKPDLIIDAKGSALAPGLIDSHCHPAFGDWTPRQNQLGWIEGCVRGRVTTLVSEGEALPGEAEGSARRQVARHRRRTRLRSFSTREVPRCSRARRCRRAC